MNGETPLTSSYGVASYGSAITLERGGNVFLAWNTPETTTGFIDAVLQRYKP